MEEKKRYRKSICRICKREIVYYNGWWLDESFRSYSDYPIRHKHRPKEG